MAASLLGAFGGSAIGSAVVRLVLDARQYDQQLAASKGKTQAGATAMGGSFAKFGAVAKAGLVGAAAALVTLGVSAVKAAADQGEALNKVNVIFGQSAQAVIAFADTSAESFGISKAAALDAAGGFGAMLKTAGLTEQAAADMSVKLVKLAADMASFNNVDPTEMLERLRSGLAGEAEPLRRFGVFISAARVNTEAYTSGIARAGDELTEAQKVQARFNLVIKDAADQSGDFARTADSLPNQLRSLRAEFDDLAAEIGQDLLPLVVDAVRLLKELLDLIDRLPHPLADTQEAFDRLGGGLGPFSNATKDAEEALAKLEEELASEGEALDNASESTGTYVRWVRNAEGELEKIVDRLPSATGAVEGFAGATGDATQASRDQTAALEAQRDAYLALVNPVFGVIDAVNEDREAEEALGEARRRLDRLTEQGKQGTRAYAEAQREVQGAALDAAQSHVGLIAAVKELLTETDTGVVTMRDAKEALREMGAAGSLTKDEIRLLVRELQAGKRALDEWNRTNFEDKRATVTITEIIAREQRQVAAGGIIAAQTGLIATGPTLLVGEGGSSTPFGRGAEAVLPLDDRTMDRLGRAIGRHLRVTTVPVVVDVAGQVISTVAGLGSRRAAL